jgi:hypothetical protein
MNVVHFALDDFVMVARYARASFKRAGGSNERSNRHQGADYAYVLQIGHTDLEEGLRHLPTTRTCSACIGLH